MSKALDLEYKNALKKIKSSNKTEDPNLRKINFVIGNTFDVFPKEQRLTEDYVRKLIYGNGN